MGWMVGQEGLVVSLEIIPELAQNAAKNIASSGIENVQILTGDGAQGCDDSAPYAASMPGFPRGSSGPGFRIVLSASFCSGPCDDPPR
jgi:precorrin-6B methylase 2